MTPALIDWLMLVQNPIAWSSVMFRAEAGRRLDPLERPAKRYVEDFDLYHRLRPFGPIAQIDDVLMLYRVHAGGASSMFNATMRTHAELVLREQHRARLGGETPDIAGLLVTHAMAREPVPDRATLDRLFAGIAALRTNFERRGDYSVEELAAVDREIARLWWRLCRTGVRSGAILLYEALGRAPLPVAQLPDLVASQVIGGVRRVRRGALGR
jgi:hypothetical protein